MTKPKITQPEIMKLISGFAFPESVFIVGLRGYYKKSMGDPTKNDRGIYDDAFALVGPNYFETFNANTDPSRFKDGIATLKPGLHYYKKGKHGLSKPGGGYDAFRPDTPDESLPVTRDGQDGTSDGIAINIHKGGYNTTSSLGCQTLYPDHWLAFQKQAYKLMDLEGQHRIPYILIEL